MSEALTNFKSQFAKSSERIHLNNAGLAPIAKKTAQTVCHWAERFYHEGYLTDLDYMTEVDHTRRLLAQLMGCQKTDIAFFQNVSNALSQLVFQLPLESGKEVVMWDQEYSSLLYPVQQACIRKNLRLKLIESSLDQPLPLENYLAAITPNACLVAISWAQFQTGAVSDLTRVSQRAKQMGAIVIVDAMQGLGVLPFPGLFDSIDAVLGGNHKWLFSPVGLGFCAIHPRWQTKLKPHNVGSGTYGSCDDPMNFACEPKKDATRFESGAKQVLEILALKSSLELIFETGIDQIQNEALRLARRLKKGLVSKNFLVRSSCEDAGFPHPIVNFTSPDTLRIQKCRSLLLTNQVTHAWRGEGIRLAPHAFNTNDEIDRVLELLTI